MAENFQHHNNWNEFQWLQELRRDERRISCYMHELVHCLDLPEENSLIYDQLASSADLVPTAEAADALHNWFFNETFDDDAEDEDISGESDTGDTISAPAANVETLGVRWNMLCAAKFSGNTDLEALALSCAFAKLFARVGEFTDPEENAPATLLRTLGKCALRDLNHLAGRINRFTAAHPDLTVEREFFLTRLGEVREALISRLDSLQK